MRRGLAPVAMLLLIVAGLGWGMPARRAVAVAGPHIAEAAVLLTPELTAELAGPGPDLMAAPEQYAGPAGPLLPQTQEAAFVPVLVYHHFLPEAIARSYNSELIVSTEDFARQMRLLSEGGYHSITTADLAAWLLHGKALPPRPVLITFDDGYESQFQYAFPILREFGVKATLFIITGSVREHNPEYNPRVLSYLDWTELKAMAASGLVDVQDHTHNMHHAVRGHAAAMGMADQAILDDLALSRRLLAMRLGTPAPHALAFPRGDYDARYLKLVKAAGFDLAFGTDPRGPVRRGDNPLTLRRIGVFRHHWIGTFRRMLDGQYP